MNRRADLLLPVKTCIPVEQIVRDALRHHRIDLRYVSEQVARAGLAAYIRHNFTNYEEVLALPGEDYVSVRRRADGIVSKVFEDAFVELGKLCIRTGKRGRVADGLALRSLKRNGVMPVHELGDLDLSTGWYALVAKGTQYQLTAEGHQEFIRRVAVDALRAIESAGRSLTKAELIPFLEPASKKNVGRALAILCESGQVLARKGTDGHRFYPVEKE